MKQGRSLGPIGRIFFLLSPILMETWSRLVEYDLVEKKSLVDELEYIMMFELC
jgi:hypothetical protein